MHNVPKRLGGITLTAGAEITASADLSGVNEVLVTWECKATAAAQTVTLYVYACDTNTSGTNSTYLTTLMGTSTIAAQSDLGTTNLYYRAMVNVAGKGRYLLAHAKNGAAGSFAGITIDGQRLNSGAVDATSAGVTKFGVA